MINFIKFTNIILVLLFLTSCKTSLNKEPSTNELEVLQKDKFNKEKRKMEIRVSCGEGDISEFLNDGWIIFKEYSEEKVCTWKSVAASEDCDIEKDKGCKITKPDKIGEEKIYILER